MHLIEIEHIGPVKAQDLCQVTTVVVQGAIKVIDQTLRATARTEVAKPAALIEAVSQEHQGIHSHLQEITTLIEVRGPVVQEARGAHIGVLAIVPTILREVTGAPLGALPDRHLPEAVPQVAAEATAGAVEAVVEVIKSF